MTRPAIPNQIVRYFYSLGYALEKSERTGFATFKESVIFFYFSYLHENYYVDDPGFYPHVFGMN